MWNQHFDPCNAVRLLSNYTKQFVCMNKARPNLESEKSFWVRLFGSGLNLTKV